MIGLLVALVTLAAGGLGLCAILRPRRAIDPLEVVGASLFLGGALVSLALFAGGLWLRGPALLAVVGAVLVLTGLAGGSALRRVSWHIPAGLGRSLWWLLPILLLVAWQAFATPLGNDGVFNFESRARLAWQNGGAIPLEFFSDPSRVWWHASYPLFVPLNELWLYLCLGEPNQSLAKIFGVLWFAASACLTLSQITRATGEPIRGWLALGLMLAVPAVVFARGGAVWGWGDFPMAAVALAAMLYLLEYRTRRTGLAMFAALLALLPWIKREGVLVGLVLLAGLLWSIRRERPWRTMIGVGLPFAAVAVGWATFTAWQPTPAVGDFAAPSMQLLGERLDRMPSIAALALRSMLIWQHWSLLWPLALLAAWRVLRTAELARWRFLLAGAGTLVAGYAGLYFFSIWPQLGWHMAVSYPRLLLTPALMMIALLAVSVPLKGTRRD